MSDQANPVVFVFDTLPVRTFTDEKGNPQFCAKDVCDALQYANDTDAIKSHCRAEGVAKRYLLTEGGRQEMTVIDEGNLYRLIIKSRKPQAKKFEAWVCDEVLPAIRRTGRYQSGPAELPPAPELIQMPLEDWAEFQRERAELYRIKAEHTELTLTREIVELKLDLASHVGAHRMQPPTGPGRGRPSQPQREEVIRLTELGFLPTQIAVRLGVSRNYVKSVLRRERGAHG